MHKPTILILIIVALLTVTYSTTTSNIPARHFSYGYLDAHVEYKDIEGKVRRAMFYTEVFSYCFGELSEGQMKSDGDFQLRQSIGYCCGQGYQINWYEVIGPFDRESEADSALTKSKKNFEGKGVYRFAYAPTSYSKECK